MKREYPEQPVVAVGAAVFSGSSVLLVQRDQEPGLGQWTLPGGAVELGESLCDAIKRELLEEASIRIGVGGLIKVFDRVDRDLDGGVRYHYVLVDYWGWIVSGTPYPGSDVSKVRMVPLGELDAFDAPWISKTPYGLPWTCASRAHLQANNVPGKIDRGLVFRVLGGSLI